MRILLALALTGATIAPAAAQMGTGAFYGPTGQYQGSYQQNGAQTYFYGSHGQYQGTIQRNGSQSYIYGPTGAYQGTIQRPVENGYAGQQQEPQW